MVKNDLNPFLATNMLNIRPLCIFLPKMSAYGRGFDKIKHIFFFFWIKDDELLEKYNENWEKVKR